MKNKSYSLFSVYGIEIEYMIVNKDTLDILPMADILIEKISGKIDNEIELGEVAVSNELALHVIEIKTNGPKPAITGLDKCFTETIRTLNKALAEFNAMLMPTGMHPWLMPDDHVKLWPHGDRKIYETYHRIFNCRGHGWANLQSMHLNLPFSGEQEFVTLHNAIRLILPFVPALTASTPFYEGKKSAVLDSRLTFYGKNQVKIPSISGSIIPEYVGSFGDYQDSILDVMYRDIASYDIDRTLQYEWLNSRGAIARFDRDAIEIRIIDSQECAAADMACAQLISALIQHVVEIAGDNKHVAISESELRKQYDEAVRVGFSSKIVSEELVRNLHLPVVNPGSIKDVWRSALAQLKGKIEPQYRQVLEYILDHGNLAERILASCPHDDIASQRATYKKLMECLQTNTVFKV